MRRKSSLILAATLVAVLLVLGACGPMPTPGAEEDTTPETPEITEEVTEAPPTEAPTEDTGTEATTEPALPESTEAEPGLCEAMPLPELPVRPVDETDWVKGEDPENADLTIFEYSDFQCPGCRGMAPVLSQFLEDYPNSRLVYRHFPLSFHDKAFVTAEAAEAAGAQGKFWEMHDLLFETVAEWSSLSEEDAREKMSEYAEQLDLDMEQFNEDMDTHAYEEKIQAQLDESMQLGLPGTPTFIFNDVMFPSDIGLSYDGLIAFLSFLDIQDRFLEPPEMTLEEDEAYQAILHTSKGDIVVDLLTDASPTHANSFVYLSEEGWYDDAAFYFAQENFVAVTGDPTDTGIGYPGYYCTGEMDGTFESAGLMGMLANGQFFVTLGEEASQLSGNFALIGELSEGLEIAQAITTRFPDDPQAPEADILESVEIIKK